MKLKLLGLVLMLCSFGAMAQNLQTFVVGNSLLTNSVVVSAAPAKLYAVLGYNASASTQYVQVFSTTNTAPTNGTMSTFNFPVASSNYFYLDFSFYGADLSPGIVVCSSTTANTLTLSATNTTIQAIIKH